VNSIYIEAKTLFENKQAVKWLDGCGAVWCSSQCKFSKYEPFDDWYVLFDYERDFSEYDTIPKNYTHTPKPFDIDRCLELIEGIL
jgi:hypothetical protein